MPRNTRNEDLFKSSTMTFGEHLEELRTCLFRALVGLAVGFIIGLFVGGRVVEFIQKPLEDALTAYYQKETVDKIEDKLKEFEEKGYALPAAPKELAEDVARVNLLPEEVYIHPSELLRELAKAYPRQLENVKLPGGDQQKQLSRENMIRFFVWHRLEDDTRVRTKSLSAHEPFVIYIKAALLAGVLVASPWIFYQIWSFVAAGLYPHEKQYVHVFLPFSLFLFLAGAATAFFFVFEPVLRFLFAFNRGLGIDPDPRISEWLDFVLMLPLGFGISFQLPLVMLFLERIGIFDVQAYMSKWRVAILVIFVISMFLTPADPTSMLLMAVPLTLLYFCGVLLCKYMPRRRSPFDEPED